MLLPRRWSLSLDAKKESYGYTLMAQSLTSLHWGMASATEYTCIIGLKGGDCRNLEKYHSCFEAEEIAILSVLPDEGLLNDPLRVEQVTYFS